MDCWLRRLSGGLLFRPNYLVLLTVWFVGDSESGDQGSVISDTV